jgi:hypothetical protein
MKPELKEQWDILAEEMDKIDNVKRRVYQFARDNGFDALSNEMKDILNAFMTDKCKPWREIPAASKTVLKAAKLALKNTLKNLK